MDRYLLFSSDNHGGATAPVYREFMERRYHEDFDRWKAARVESAEAAREAMSRMGVHPPTQQVAEVDRTEARIFGTQLDKRLARLEQEGIVGEVIYPGPASGPEIDEYGVPFSGSFGETLGADGFDLHAAGHRAHNRWLAETSPDLGRQLGLALIAYDDVDRAVAEIRRSAQAGLRGVLLEGVHPTLPPMDDPCYDPMWSACEEHDMPIHFHAGIGIFAVQRITGPSSDGRPWARSTISSVESLWLSHRPLWYLTLGGVCERHPKLRIVFGELGAKWAMDSMQQLTWYWQQGKATPHPPIHYYERQVFFGASQFTTQTLEARHYVGVDKLMWGGDHPHSQGSWDCTAAWLRATLGAAHVEDAEARAILGDTLVDFYGLDAAALRTIADRVGPTWDDVLREPDQADLDDPHLVRSLSYTH